MLNLYRLRKSHTAENIKDVISICLNTWNISYTNTPIFFVTDNARNMVRAISLCKDWSRIPCFAHSLQLVVKMALKKFSLYAILRQQCKDIVNFFAKSTSARERFKEVQRGLMKNSDETVLQLIQEVDTRWNATYLMFERLLHLKRPLTLILCDDNMPNNLSSEEWRFISIIVNILQPIKEATDFMCGETYPTLTDYIPIYLGLKNIFETYSTENEIASEL